MKLLSIIFTASILLFSTSNINAQGFYISAGGGYAFGTNGTTDVLFNSEREEIFNQQIIEYSSTNTIENVNLSFGKGFNFGLNAGFMFNDYVGVDLGVSYLFGGKTEGNVNTTTTSTDQNGNVTVTTIKDNSIASSEMVRITPSIVLTPSFDKFNPYVRFGVVVGFGGYSIENNRVTDLVGSVYTINKVSEWSEGVAIGFSGAIGVEFPVSGKLKIFGEVNYIGLSYSVSKQVYTKYEVDGVDMLPQMSKSQKETILKDSYTWTNNQPINPDEPSVSNKISMPFSSIGFNIGVKFNLSK